MNCLGLGGGKSRRLFTRQTLLIAIAVCIVWAVWLQFSNDLSQHWSDLGPGPSASEGGKNYNGPKRMPTHNVLPPMAERIACHGPRGHLLGQSRDDDLQESELDGRKHITPRPGDCLPLWIGDRKLT